MTQTEKGEVRLSNAMIVLITVLTAAIMSQFFITIGKEAFAKVAVILQ